VITGYGAGLKDLVDLPMVMQVRPLRPTLANQLVQTDLHAQFYFKSQRGPTRPLVTLLESQAHHAHEAPLPPIRTLWCRHARRVDRGWLRALNGAAAPLFPPLTCCEGGGVCADDAQRHQARGDGQQEGVG